MTQKCISSGSNKDFEKEKELQAIKERNLKRLEELSQPSKDELVYSVDGNIYRNRKLIAEQLTDEQEKWVDKKMAIWWFNK
jgi:hypothetical protein